MTVPMRFAPLLPSALALLSPASGDEIVVGADLDNTLYESMDGTLSNGAGEYLFAGTTDSGQVRRALVRFDVSAVPANATVYGARIDMQVSKVPFLPPATVLDVHRVLGDWGEGASDAPLEEGGGAPSEEDDATWIHRFYPDELWAAHGGDFDPDVHATTVYSGGVGPVDWSSAELAADVQGWVDDPAANFGWLIKARDESDPRHSKRFDSRQFLGDPATRPRLTIQFVVPGGSVPALPRWGPAAVGLALVAAAGLVLRRGRIAGRAG